MTKFSKISFTLLHSLRFRVLSSALWEQKLYSVSTFLKRMVLQHRYALAKPTEDTCLTRMGIQRLPWWRSGWEPACQCRGHGFEPWSGNIPHATEQLGPWATTAELACLEPVLRNKRGCDSERPAHRDEEWPPLAATRVSPRTETKTQHS